MAIIDHEIQIKLEDEAIIWRYMALSKFESLLKEKALFFCRADKFSDPYECSVPKREANYRSSEESFRVHEEVIGRTEYKYDKIIAQNASDGIAHLHQRVKRGTIVNCWHINNQESDGMWRLYLKDNEGVAIRSTKPRLINALSQTSDEVGMSKVRYLDYENGIWYDSVEFPFQHYSLITPLIHKRLEFKHENELRLYHQNPDSEIEGYWEEQPEPKGKFISIDVNQLVESVIFHPTMDEKTVQRIKALVEQYGFVFNFEESRMAIPPTY